MGLLEMLGCGGAVVTESLPAWGSDPAGNGEARAGAGLYMREGLCLASSCKNRYIHICLCWPGHLPHEYKVLPQIMLPLLILLEGSRWRLGSSLSEPQQPVSSCVLIRFLSSLLCFLGGAVLVHAGTPLTSHSQDAHCTASNSGYLNLS